MDMYLNVNQTEFYTYKEYVKDFPMQPVPADEFGGAVYTPPDILSPEVFLQWKFEQKVIGQRALMKQKMLEGMKGQEGSSHQSHQSHQSLLGSNHGGQEDFYSDHLKMAVFGTHATLSLEPVHMIRNFVLEPSLRPIREVFYGLETRWCKLMGMCNRGDPAFAKFFKDQEQDPYDFPWSKMEVEVRGVYERDENIRNMDLLLCTEPLVGCLLLQKLIRELQNRRAPMIGYLGVALLNSVPPLQLDQFWDLLDERKEFDETVTIYHCFIIVSLSVLQF